MKKEDREKKRKRENESTLKERLSYRFDNMMAKGMIVQAGMLFLATVIVIFIMGMLIQIMDHGNIHSFEGGMWNAFLHMLDGGTIAGDEAGPLYLFLMLISTIVGLFITATLIGIINESLSGKMEMLRKGKSKVLENEHTVILGFDSGIYTILESLMVANENQQVKAPIVIMDENFSKDEMEDQINAWLTHMKRDEKIFGTYNKEKYKTKIICRHGSISNIKSISTCSPRTAKSIIVNCEDDFLTVKSILAAAENIKGEPAVRIVAAVKDRDYEKTANLAGVVCGDIRNIKVLYTEDFIARLIAHTSREPGISQVFMELLDYDDNEIYVEKIPDAVKGRIVGESVFALNQRLGNAVVIGLKHQDRTIELNPAPETVVADGDKLIMIEEDDGTYLNALADTDEVCVVLPEVTASDSFHIRRRNTLILGYSPKIAMILNEAKRFVTEDSRFVVVFDEDDRPKKDNELKDAIDRSKDRILAELKSIEPYHLDPIYIDLYKGSDYEQLLDHLRYDEQMEIDNVMILSDTYSDPDVNDADMLGLLLRIRDYADKREDVKYSITTEMMKVENKELAVVTKEKDFIVSEDVTNLMISQISETPELFRVYRELLSENGSEIYMHAFTEYPGLSGESFHFSDAYRCVAGSGATLIGVYDYETGECFINPDRNKKIPYIEQNKFIVIESGRKPSKGADQT